MPKLLWDRVGQRLYEAGIDRGVLYLSDSTGVAWNGLTGVEEDMGDDTSEPFYLDGVKYTDNPAIGDFSARLSAFTYPDEFLEFDGIIELGEGMFVDGQSPKRFGMAFRTLVGNDVDTTDHGYKIHLLYNLTAVPEPANFETLGESPNPLEFAWTITGVPVGVPGFRPTAHYILDSRFLPADILSAIEDILYGTTVYGDMIYDGGHAASPGGEVIDGGHAGDLAGWILPDYGIVSETPPRLPPIGDLFDLITLWAPKLIVPDSLTGLALLIDDPEGDITPAKKTGVYTGLPNNRLSPTTVAGIYQLT